jgi:Tol biopolymer transport system component
MRDLAPELRRGLDAIEAPDLWPDIGGREPGQSNDGPSPLSHIGAVVLALVVAAGGLVLISRAFRTEPAPVRPAARVENGVLAFRAWEIWVVNPDGSGLRRLNTLECINDACDVAEGSLVLTPWEWSPDGTLLACYGYAYHADDEGGADHAIYLLSADGNEVTDLTSGLPELEGTSQGNPHWSPDGTKIAFDNDDGLYVVNVDGTGVTKVARGGFPTWSPDGSRIAFVTGSEGGGSEIRVVNADGTGETTITDGRAQRDLPAWSPDGSKIAYVGWEKGEGPQLYVVTLDGNETRLTDLRSDGMGGYSPSWSPDGATVAIEVFEDGNWNLYLAQADGSGVRNLTDLPGDENRPTWAPDGTRLAFMGSATASSEDISASFDVYTIYPDGTGLRRLTHGAGAAPGALTWQPRIVSDASPSASPSPAASMSAAVAATTTVGADGAVRSLVYGEGAVWVAVTGKPAGPGTVLRIETDEIEATIPVDAVPGWEVGGAGMTIGAGSVWVTGSVEDPGDPPAGIDAVLVRIDPSTNEVAATIPLGEGRDGYVAVDESGVWVAIGGNEQGQLIRIDPSTNEVVARIPIAHEGAAYQDLRQVVTVDDVVLVTQPTFDDGGSAITVVDVATNRVLETAIIRVPQDMDSSIGPLAAWNGQVWADNGYRLVRIDQGTGQLLDDAVELPEALAAGLLTSDDRGLWFLGYDGRTGEGPRTLSLFDPETGEVQTFVDVPGIAPNAMAVAPDSVWVLDYHGTLTRIELR